MSISPLRQRMIDDMTARHFGEKAQKDYIRCVKTFAAFLPRGHQHDPQSDEPAGPAQPDREKEGRAHGLSVSGHAASRA